VLEVQAFGTGGVSELVQRLHDNEVQFALLRMTIGRDASVPHKLTTGPQLVMPALAGGGAQTNTPVGAASCSTPGSFTTSVEREARASSSSPGNAMIIMGGAAGTTGPSTPTSSNSAAGSSGTPTSTSTAKVTTAGGGVVTAVTTRDIFIGWIGPKVGIVTKGKKKAHVGEVKELLKVRRLPLFRC
jgi:hypothetical protein